MSFGPVFSPAARFEAPDRRFAGHRDILTRSLARYHFVLPQIQGRVLDVGCGRGYGLELMEPRSRWQAGVDAGLDFLYDALVQAPGHPLACARAERLPFGDGSFDTVVAFEVIEHVEDDLALLRETKRIAGEAGLVLLSTPNRSVSSGASPKPLNPFHVREYGIEEFCQLLAQVFGETVVFGQFDGARPAGSPQRPVSGLIDRVPLRWKYLLPAHVQDVFSVTLRPPLALAECRFERETLEQCHTLLALCRA